MKKSNGRPALIGTLIGLTAAACGAGAGGKENPARTVDPNLPTAGRSLFDQFLAAGSADGKTLDVPFPFTKLLSTLDTQARIMGQLSPDAETPLVGILIPYGRSLQKLAADPEFLRFPRALVTMVPENVSTLHGELFVAYNEVAQTLEIISYNAAAGRYEFQIVKDYAADKVPRLLYAQRKVCTTCHQNEGPIFPELPWSETNGIPFIAQRIADARGSTGETLYNGVPIVPPAEGLPVGSVFAYRYDLSVRKADQRQNAQNLWGARCSTAPVGGIECRGLLLKNALHLALTDRFSAPGGPELVEQFRAATGLELINDVDEFEAVRSVLEDRDPGIDDTAASLVAARESILSLPTDLDPATPRQQTSLGAPSMLDTFVSSTGLLTPQERDSMLTTVAKATAAAANPKFAKFLLAKGTMQIGTDTVQIHLDPSVTVDSSITIAPFDVTLKCTLGAGGCTVQKQSSVAITLPSGVAAGVVEKLEPKVAGRGKFEPEPGEIRIKLEGGQDELALALQCRDLAAGDVPETIDIVCEAIDLSILMGGIDDLVARTKAGQIDALSDKPLRRCSVVSKLLESLGASAGAEYCFEIESPPELDSADDALTRLTVSDERLRTFFTYCDACHRSPVSNGIPNFLYGSTEQDIWGNIATLKPLITKRLTDPSSPMPPLTSLQSELLQHNPGAREELLQALETLP